MNRSLLLICISLSFAIHAEEIEDLLVDIFQNNKECTQEFRYTLGTQVKLSEIFDTDLKVNLDVLEKIFDSFCNPETVDSQFFLEVSEEIFKHFNEMSSLIYAIHLSKFEFYFNDLPPQAILSNLLAEAELIEANKEKFSKDGNLVNIFENLLIAIDLLSLSEFSDHDNELQNINRDVNFLLTYLESFIMTSISSDIDLSNLQRIGQLLMQIRMNKMTNFNFYGSSVEQFAQREEFIKVYLNNYKNGFIDYLEFDEIINSQSNSELGQFKFQLSFSADQAQQLASVTVGVNAFNKPTESGLFYFDFTDRLLIEKFDEAPEPILLRLLATFNYSGDQYCELLEKTMLVDKEQPKTYINSVGLNILKYGCQNDIRFLTQSIRDNIALLDTNIFNDYDFDLRYDLFTDSILYNHRAVLTVLISDLGVDNKEHIDDFYSAMYEYATKLLQSFSSESRIKSYESLSLLNLVIQLVNINTDYLSNSNTDDQARLLNLNSLFRSKVSVDPDELKKELQDLNPNENESSLVAMGLSFSILNAMTDIDPDFTPESSTKFINTLAELNQQDEKLIQLLDNLDLIKFFLDNIDDFHISQSVEAILQRPSLDKWNIFKDLLSIEVYVDYVLVSANQSRQKNRTPLLEKRVNQLLRLRPDEISIEKYKDIFIKSTNNQDLSNLLILYDNAQKKYRNLIDSRILLNQGVYALSSDSRANLELQYKGDLLNIQTELFSEYYEQEVTNLFNFDVTTIDFIQNALAQEEVMFSMLAGNFFTFSLIVSSDRFWLTPLLASTGMSGDKINEYLESLSNPEIAVQEDLPEYFYDYFLTPLEMIDAQAPSIPIKTVYVVPDIHFSTLPLHASYDGIKKEWAIEKYSFQYLSSEKLILYLNKKEISGRDSFVGFGNPTLSRDSLRNQVDNFFSNRGELDVSLIKELSSLPETQVELNKVSSFFLNKKLFFKDQALESNLSDPGVQNADLIAFATHSVRGMNKFYNDRGLVLTPISSNEFEKDGFLSSMEIKELDLLKNPTIILTACNTFEAPYYRSQPYSGIASSFMEAGANSVLLSLWNINSLSAKEFNESLFQNSNSFYLGDRVQDSMISMINSEKYAHPHYWAPYVYLGR
ncbi:CHAT domain-containing protein [Gammaproteobacteria bacterium]|nr:CHAT domain-containing protein [Gammaproteobacteria bacterium]